MRIFIYILPLIVFFSCKPTKSASEDLSIKEPSEAMIVIELAAGTNGGFKTPVKKVITTQEEFSKTWETAYSNFLNAEKPPRVDFEEYNVILIALGMKTSGGYTIKVSDATNSKENVLVNVIETSPGKDCITTDAITFPFQLIQLKKTEGKVVFNTSEKTIDCESK